MKKIGFFFVIQKEKRQPGLFFFKLQIANYKQKKYAPEPEKIGLMQPYIF